MDKPALAAAFRRLLEERLAALESGQAAARDGTRVDGSHRPANRGERAAVTAQGYLALGLAERAAALRGDLVLLDEVDLGPAEVVRSGALLTLLGEDGMTERILILPGGHGDVIDGITIISPRAPLARALAGLEAGAVATVARGGRGMERELEAVS